MTDIDALEALAKAATSGLPGDRITFALHAMDPEGMLALIAEVRALREDAERYRWAISREDNAEKLYGAVISNAPDVATINAEIDGLMAKDKA